MSSYNKSDISEEEIFKNYSLTQRITDDGLYTVFVYDLRLSSGGDRSSIGTVKKYNGEWHVIGDKTKEFRDLYDAIKRAIDNYLQSQKEFLELKFKFKETQSIKEPILLNESEE